MATIAEILASAAETTQALSQAADAEAFKRCWSESAAEIGWVPAREPRAWISMSSAPAAKPKRKTEAERMYAKGQRAKYAGWLARARYDSEGGWRHRQAHSSNIDPIDPVEAEG